MRSISRSLIGLCAVMPVVSGASSPLPTRQTATISETIPATAPVKQLDIARQPLDAALNKFAQQMGLQVVFLPELARGLTAPRVSGRLTPQAALDLLLSGTLLEYEFINERMVAIRAREKGIQTQKGATGPGVAQRFARVARLDPPATGSPLSHPSPQEQAAVNGDDKGIPELIVKGSRSSNADIRRTEDDVQPYVVFGHQEIARSGALNIEDFLKTRLPMNTTFDTISQDGGGVRGNQSEVNLRGLGANQTLILLNGRRMPSTFTLSTGSGFNQPDINGISLAAVERIEVLPATASGIYGGGATGGVVNIILRRDYTGMEILASYGNTFDTDAMSRRLDAGAGFTFEQGRTRLLLSASYSSSNPLLVSDRDFADRGRRLLEANDPEAWTVRTTPPVGYTANICRATVICNGLELVLDNGTPLGSSITYVPVGYAGPASDGGAALAANAGGYNIDIPGDLGGGARSLLNNPTVHSFAASLRRDFSDNAEVFLDLSSLHNRGRSFSTGLNIASVLVLPADAPNNPFDSPIRVNTAFPALSFPIDSVSATLQAAGGLILRLPRRWSAGLDYSWSRARVSSEATSPALAQPIGGALQNGTLDVLRDTNAYPLDFSDYLLPSPNQFYGPADTVLQTATLRLAGPALALPAGNLKLTGLLEWRQELAEPSYFRSLTTAAGNPMQVRYSDRQSQAVKSAYLEALVPLLEGSGDPAITRLQLQASVRHDEYRTSGHAGAVALPSIDAPPPSVSHNINEVASTDYTLGLRFAPARSLILRASFGTGFLAPSLSQITALQRFNVSRFFSDPKRGGTGGSVIVGEYTSGGNPGLAPEQSASLSAGLVFLPLQIPGLRLSADYTRVKKTNEIGVLFDQQVLDNEDMLPGRVVRGEKADGEPDSWAGPVIGLNTSALNISRTTVEAYDVQLDYSMSAGAGGTLAFYALATYQPRFERQVAPNSEPENAAGYYLGPLKWRGNAGITWSQNAWSAAWNMQYFHSYLSYSTFQAANPAQVIQRQGSASIPRQIYHDLHFRYRFDDSPAFARRLLANTEISMGIQNIFDRSPPIVAGFGSTGGYSFYGDPRLRRYSIAIRRDF